MIPGHEVDEVYAALLAKTLPRSITSDADAAIVQDRIDALIDRPEPLTEAEAELLSLLGDLILAWEAGRYDLPELEGIEAVKELLRLRGLRQTALVGPVFATRSLASEVLAGKRRLTYDHVQKLADFFHVSPAIFYRRSA